MIVDALFAVGGMFIGWFFLPTPQWAKNLLSFFEKKVPEVAVVQKAVDAPAVPTPPAA